MATPEARAKYPMIEDVDWEILGYKGHLAMRQPDGISDEIHDLFQYNLPGRRVAIWPNTSLEQYQEIREVLEPVFRLATKLLLCPASLDWFYYLIYAPRTRTDPLVQHNGDDVYEYRRDDTPRWERHNIATAALKRLAKVHTIELTEFGADNPDEGLTRPTTENFAEGVNIKDSSGSSKSGIAPKFIIDQIFLQKLKEMRMKGSQSSVCINNLTTKMALTWDHEFGHGAWMASSEKLLSDVLEEIRLRKHAAAHNIQRDRQALNINEDLFEDESCAESGYSWESFVFGGNIEVLDFDFDNPLVLSKWPNFLKGNRDLRRGGWKPTVTQYFVPWAWVVNVNSQSWWDAVKVDDNTALYIKKLVGVRRACPFPDLDEDWSSSQSSEGIWKTDEELTRGWSPSQRVSRMKPGTTVEDPSAARANEWAR